jgi:RimJ/RimL family protein N-acetyltransferase
MMANFISGTKIRLREKRLADAWEDYQWRTDPELAELDAAPILRTTFSEYLYTLAYEIGYSLSHGILMAIETLDGKHIGNCSYYNVSEDNSDAELGIMIGNRNYWDRGYGTEAVAALLNYIFSTTSLKRIYLKTLESNLRAQKCFQKCGFTPFGYLYKDGHSFMLMQVYRDEWQRQSREDTNQAKLCARDK